MITNTDHGDINLTLTIPPSFASLLAAQATRNFTSEQLGRFIQLGDGDLLCPHAPEFDNGTLLWTDCVADALLLRAYEEATGHVVLLLSDEGDEYFRGVVVLTSRNFASLR